MKRIVRTLDLARLHEALHYDPDTGAFTWKVRNRRHTHVGASAGYLNDKGYLVIGLDGETYLAHRLAWFYVHGVWPDQIDHINGMKSDNRLLNLRDVTPRLNNHNRHRANRDNALGYLGVHRVESGRFRAQINVGGRVKVIGLFDTPQAAHAAYVSAKHQYHEGFLG